MLEGLEVSVVKYKETSKNKDFRIDTDFWTKQPKINPTLKYGKIGDFLVSSQYGISIEMNEEKIGYPIYRMNEIHNMVCDFEVSKHADISKNDFNVFKLEDRDVLFNRTNSYEWVGRTGIYRKTKTEDYIFASYLVRFVPNQNVILPEYLSAFLNTKYGIWDIKRRARQSINQTNVNPEEVKQIDIPLLRIALQNLIKKNFDVAVDCLLKSQSLYTQAEQLLLEELGLQDWQPSTENINCKSFKESFLATGRLDAEYYQPKYEDYHKLIVDYHKGYKLLEMICNLKDSNFTPKDAQEYRYIELSNVGKSGELTGCTTAQGIDLPSRARRKVNVNDVIISSIEGSLGSCALITDDYNNAICSTGFYVINSKEINSETLLVLFKSELMQNILKQNCSGTILTAVNKSEFQNIPIPIIDFEKQQEISTLIQESFVLKHQSEHLLEIAKRAVEIAIEEDEEKAIEYINENGIL